MARRGQGPPRRAVIGRRRALGNEGGQLKLSLVVAASLHLRDFAFQAWQHASSRASASVRLRVRSRGWGRRPFVSSDGRRATGDGLTGDGYTVRCTYCTYGAPYQQRPRITHAVRLIYCALECIPGCSLFV
ncbi:hypothetical protein BU26DRAFT_12186 [Trematosphaeria pertusa]|uniref:Uncharacterized protein n=1 Tax=Trematosphaeria pertusa TaxID=390896 RepID=A0A6A6IZR0_9PLEO|nr:uncharacterized protein BU26DRAFT_12186 [Trematosphaeria pertusa]KAF2255939.1 hypothetical protein BU26DRAFT_12186 [Trematosphaeria pertusa]